MPYAPPRSCQCGSIIPHGQRCARCARSVEAARPDRHARGYDTAWYRVRKEHLARQPACVVCGVREGVDVDHKISIRERPDLRLDPANLQTLCRLHHNRKTHGRVSIEPTSFQGLQRGRKAEGSGLKGYGVQDFSGQGAGTGWGSSSRNS